MTMIVKGLGIIDILGALLLLAHGGEAGTLALILGLKGFISLF
jgi:hypothetical protein